MYTYNSCHLSVYFNVGLIVFFLSPQGVVPLFQSWESFYTRNVYRRIRDCWNIPIASCAGSHIDVQERVSPDYGWNLEYVLGTCGMLVIRGECV